MPPKCKCGHGSNRHEIEPPYPCYECGCQSFTVPTERDEIIERAKEFWRRHSGGYSPKMDGSDRFEALADFAIAEMQEMRRRLSEMEAAYQKCLQDHAGGLK